MFWFDFLSSTDYFFLFHKNSYISSMYTSKVYRIIYTYVVMHNIISCQRVFSSNLSFFFSDLNLLFELELDSFRYTFLTNFNLFNDLFKELKNDKHPQKQRPHNLLRNIEFCQKKYLVLGSLCCRLLIILKFYF